MAGRIEKRKLRELEEAALAHALIRDWRSWHGMSAEELADFRAKLSALDDEIVTTLMGLHEAEIARVAHDFVLWRRRNRK